MSSTLNLSHLYEKGYAIARFRCSTAIDQMQNQIRKNAPCDPLHLHKNEWITNDWLHFVEITMIDLHRSEFIDQLIQDNIELFVPLFGEDIYMQAHPHLRISRPASEEDMVDWHRDSFYGNSPWEINVWVPIFSLGEGAGLLYAEGSHRIPSTDLQDIPKQQITRIVEKGSIENRLGFAYAPKSDATLRELDPTKVQCLRPHVGECIVFFGCGLHRAINESKVTRLSLDLRLKQRHAPTNTKPGYFREIHRGLVSRVVDEFSQELMCCGK